jgi:hypothetical protein
MTDFREVSPINIKLPELDKKEPPFIGANDWLEENLKSIQENFLTKDNEGGSSRVNPLAVEEAKAELYTKLLNY